MASKKDKKTSKSFSIKMALFALLSIIVSIVIRLKYRYNGIPDHFKDKTIFDFKVNALTNEANEVSLSEYKGKKAYLVVNVASKCGLTERNYSELQDIYEKYR